jgi:hypothetical protein
MESGMTIERANKRDREEYGGRRDGNWYKREK